MAATRPREESFSSDSWIFYRCRSASLWDAAITYSFMPKMGDERDEEADYIPADYPSQVRKWLHCIWALRQYSSKQIASDNHAHVHPGISAPPQYSCISHCSSWLRVWGGEIFVWAFHTTVGRRWIDGPTNHNVLTTLKAIVLTLLSPLQNSSIDVNSSGRKTFICSSWLPSWLTSSLFHRINLNLASRGHITTRSWSNLIILPEYHLCGAQWLNQISQFTPSSLPARTTSSGTIAQAQALQSRNFPKL